MPAPNATKWDEKAHSDLLLAMVSEVKFSKEQWARIVDKVHTKGYKYTVDAVMQHLTKLAKKERDAAPAAGSSEADGGDGDGDEVADPTPKKAKRPARPRKAPKKDGDETAAPKRKRVSRKKKQPTPVQDDSDDELGDGPGEEDSPSTSKKMKLSSDNEQAEEV